MKNFKEALVDTFGVVGFILWFLLGAVLLFLPLSFLDFPLWVNFVIILVLINTRVLGDMLSIVLWIWSFTEVIAHPIDGWSIFYFVGFVIYLLTSILPTVLGIISNIIESIRARE